MFHYQSVVDLGCPLSTNPVFAPERRASLFVEWKTMYDATLLFLLKGGHLNVPDRIARSLWPHPPLTLDAVTEYLAGVLESGERWFPCEFQPPCPGEVIREGGVVERQSANQYVYRSQTHHPLSPTTLNSSGERVFSNARDAAAHYLRWDLHLPVILTVGGSQNDRVCTCIG